MAQTPFRPLSSWFAGPKAENGDRFASMVSHIITDHYYWRRNYFPEDGQLLDSAQRQESEGFFDRFDDRLTELLGRLKADFPFHSPRYAAHMLSDQTLPSIAGYFAAMLYNPNNVTSEAAPVTVQLELEAANEIASMIGYDQDSWSHLTSGGTVANFEALWMARTVKYLPFVTADMARTLGFAETVPQADLLHLSPRAALEQFERVFQSAPSAQLAIQAYLDSPHNVVEQGIGHVINRIGSEPVILVPETHHYCFEKAADLLGLGRNALQSVAVDSDFRMRIDALQSALEKLEHERKHVLALVAVIGSTEEGAVDPLHKIIEACKCRNASGEIGFWVHADAAYGGYLRTLTQPNRIGLGPSETEVMVQGKRRMIALDLPEEHTCDSLESLPECDSVTIDPHKLGYVPYPAGAICFRSNLVKPLARQSAPYLEEPPSDVEHERHGDSIGLYVLEGSKPGAAAASVWLSQKLIALDSSEHGMLVQETIRNACELHSLLQLIDVEGHHPEVRYVPLCQPGANIVCFAFAPCEPSSLEQINELNRQIYGHFSLQKGGKVYGQSYFVSRTTLSSQNYSPDSVAPFLERLGVDQSEYETQGVFLLRSVIMNPWYSVAKQKGRFYVSDFAKELYGCAAHCWKQRSQ